MEVGATFCSATPGAAGAAATGLATIAMLLPASSAAARSLFAFDMLFPLFIDDSNVATRVKIAEIRASVCPTGGIDSAGRLQFSQPASWISHPTRAP
jgi:hypothetical protein